MKLLYPLVITLVAVLLLPTSALAYVVRPDLSSMSASESVEGFQTIADHLTISSTGSTVVVEEQNPVSAAYGAPNKYLSSWGDATKNGCLEKPGSDPTDSVNMGYGKGFADSQKKHDYTFEFEEGWEVSEFSVRMLDFGDYNPDRKKSHKVVLTAYDSDNNDLGDDVLSYTTDNAVNPTSHWYTGDACTAEEGEPGNFVFDITAPEGKTIAKLTLKVEEGLDPNIALSSLEYSFAPTDDDDDGVPNDVDVCSSTELDKENIPEEDWGVNRWVWNGGYDFYQVPLPNSKGKGNKMSFSMEDTGGCSCYQILNKMSEKLGGEYGGHYKFGCSNSIMQEWTDRYYHVGPVHIEDVEVMSDGSTAISSNSLQSDTDYFLRPSGTYRFANWGEYGIADAEWSYRYGSYYPADPSLTDLYPTVPGAGWVKGEGYFASACGLDVQVDGLCVDWGSFNTSHEYEMAYAGTGAPVSFSIYDNNYKDNSGFININIYEDKWIDLWM